MATLGIVVGLLVASGVTRILTGLLYEVDLVDPLTLCAVAGLLVVVTLAATVLPASAAARVDPIAALKRP